MIPLERQRRILTVLNDRGTATIADLQDLLGVSHMTVRRDIAALEELGRVVSVTGGASLPARLVQDHSHARKEGMQPREKFGIARAAAAEVRPGSLVLLDAGTTTLAIARELADHSDLSFLTNDLAIAAFLSDHGTGQELIIAGGGVDLANQSTEGSHVARMIAEFNVDIAFLSTSSFDLRGLSVPSEAKKVVKRAILENAARTLLATDSTKYGKVAAHRAVALSELNAVITDAGLPDSAREAISRMDVSLVLTDAGPTAAPDRKAIS